MRSAVLVLVVAAGCRMAVGPMAAHRYDSGQNDYRVWSGGVLGEVGLVVALVLAGCRFGGGPAVLREKLAGLSGEVGGYFVAAKTPQVSDVVAGAGAFLIGGVFQTPYERHNPFALKGVDVRYRRSFAGPPQRRWFGAAAFTIADTNYGGDDAGYGGHLQIGRELAYEHASVDVSFRYGLLVEETTVPTTRNIYFHFFHLSVSYGFALRN